MAWEILAARLDAAAQAGKLLLLFLSASMLVPDCVAERSHQPNCAMRRRGWHWLGAECMPKTHSYPSAEFHQVAPNVEVEAGKGGADFHPWISPKIKIPPKMEHSRGHPDSDTQWPLPARPWAGSGQPPASRFRAGPQFLVLLRSPAGSSQRTLAAMTGRGFAPRTVLLHLRATHGPAAGPRVPSSWPIHPPPVQPVPSVRCARNRSSSPLRLVLCRLFPFTGNRL